MNLRPVRAGIESGLLSLRKSSCRSLIPVWTVAGKGMDAKRDRIVKSLAREGSRYEATTIGDQTRRSRCDKVCPLASKDCHPSLGRRALLVNWKSDRVEIATTNLSTTFGFTNLNFVAFNLESREEATLLSEYNEKEAGGYASAILKCLPAPAGY